ncbi:hypothetical protein SAMN02910398_02183 [Butyrivibrio sp. YAB3001]|nr:hypothetical protein SAMN02910398_02183 [Butyrivibrio sp. YAB3001]
MVYFLWYKIGNPMDTFIQVHLLVVGEIRYLTVRQDKLTALHWGCDIPLNTTLRKLTIFGNI